MFKIWVRFFSSKESSISILPIKSKLSQFQISFFSIYNCIFAAFLQTEQLAILPKYNNYKTLE